MPYLVLVRHGESEWNALGLWTGWTDVNLSDKGYEEAIKAAQDLKHIHFDLAYTSNLKRAKQTLASIMIVLRRPDLPSYEYEEFNERHYGSYTGKNKWQIKDEVGDEEFLRIRRSWDYQVPVDENGLGESLKMVYERVVKCYLENVLPKLKEGKNVIIVAHGNSLRALTKYLENISDDKIADLELPTGQPFIHRLDF